jgi:hypothetical protein
MWISFLLLRLSLGTRRCPLIKGVLRGSNQTQYAQNSLEGFLKSLSSVICLFDTGSPLNGIISYLTKKSDGHVEDRGVVSVSASSVYDPQVHPLRLVAGFENQTYFCTKKEPNSWIYYDFKSMRIKPTHYSLRSRRDGNSDHLRYWTLEGSLDGKEWIELNRQVNNMVLNAQGATATFPVSLSDELQMIRVRQLGKNSSKYDELVISAIEVFGILIEAKQ